MLSFYTLLTQSVVCCLQMLSDRIRLFICLFVCVIVCLFVCLFVCLLIHTFLRFKHHVIFVGKVNIKDIKDIDVQVRYNIYFRD